MMTKPSYIPAILVVSWLAGPVVAVDTPVGLLARLKPESTHVSVGSPVWVHFFLENTTDKPITLTVPGSPPELPPPEMGLPLSHLYSGGGSAGVYITTESGRRWELPVGYRAPSKAPLVQIAPHGTVGTRLDLREHFPSLRGAGQYRIVWKPYGGSIVSDPVVINIAPLKQVEVVTDEGNMTLKLFYDDAPENVANFLELVKTGFYSGKAFHRLEPGYMLQGGCSRGDGTGIRPDGKRVRSEMNNHPHQKGSVSMALLDDDPDSGSCQFFVSNTRQKEWDGKYTVFAELVGEESFATLDRLMATPIDEFGRPAKTIYMRTVKTSDAPVEATDNPVSSSK